MMQEFFLSSENDHARRVAVDIIPAADRPDFTRAEKPRELDTAQHLLDRLDVAVWMVIEPRAAPVAGKQQRTLRR